MSDTPLPDGLVTLIKSSTRAMVAAAFVPGSTGPERVEQLTGYSRGSITRWQGDAYKDIAPLDMVFLLEFLSQKPIFARALASLTGHRLVPIEEGEAPDDLIGDLIRVTASGSRVSSQLGAALADGVVTPGEAKESLKEIGAHQEALTDVQRKLVAIVGGGARG